MNIHELRLNDDRERRDAYAQLARVIKEKNVDAGVAIGVAFGGQAEVILEQLNAGELLGVDAYEPAKPNASAVGAGSPDAPAIFSAEQHENLFWYMMGRLSRFGPRYNHLRGSSAQASQILNVELDFVALDGDRSQRGLLQDLSLWYPKLRGGGVIGGHGYAMPASPGVKLAVDQVFNAAANVPIHVEATGVWWIQKNV